MAKRKLTAEEKTKLDTLRATHGEVKPYVLGDGRFVAIRACNSFERVQMVKGATAKPERDGTTRIAETHAEIAPEVIVLPETREEALALLRKYPALNERFAQDAFELAEGGIEELGNV
jgi:hypothetical protein